MEKEKIQIQFPFNDNATDVRIDVPNPELPEEEPEEI